MNAHTPRRTIDLDALYRDLPDTRPAMRWPVWGFQNPSQPTVAVFFDYYAAVDFVNSELPTRNLYVGEPTRFVDVLHHDEKGVWL